MRYSLTKKKHRIKLLYYISGEYDETYKRGKTSDIEVFEAAVKALGSNSRQWITCFEHLVHMLPKRENKPIFQ